jgi:transcriptional regulator with XRE-family HTH domain
MVVFASRNTAAGRLSLRSRSVLAIFSQKRISMAPRTNPFDQHVGRRLRFRRQRLAMTQVMLGNALGVSYQQVQKYENGKDRIGAGRLQHLAHILQVPPTYSFDGAPRTLAPPIATGKGRSAEDLTKFLATPHRLALVRAFTKIRSTDLRRQIIRLVHKIVEAK